MKRNMRTLNDVQYFDEGALAATYQELWLQAMADCWARPTVDAARKITITILLTPVPSVEGKLDRVDTEAEVKHHPPVFRSRKVAMLPVGIDGLMYNDQSPDDPKQMTLDEIDQPAGE